MGWGSEGRHGRLRGIQQPQADKVPLDKDGRGLFSNSNVTFNCVPWTQQLEVDVTAILGVSVLTPDQAIAWAVSRGAVPEVVIPCVSAYWELSAQGHPVRPEVAFAQMCRETGFGHFGGTDPIFSATAAMHNPCGIKLIDGSKIASFVTWNTGCRAHLDHLALKAGAKGFPKPGSPDPRHMLSGLFGRNPTVERLGGSPYGWSPDPTYGSGLISSYLAPMLAFKSQGVVPMVVSPLSAITIPGYSGHTEGSNGTIIRVVMHGTVSPCVRGGARSTANYFQSPGSGGLGHYVVDPGEIVNCASEDLATWGAPPNEGEIHVEMCDPQAGDPARWQDADHQAMVALSARLVADICTRQGVPKTRLSAASVLNGTRGICGHAEVSAAFHQTDHTDPDAGGPFPWSQFMTLVTGGTSVAFAINPPIPVDGQIVDWHLTGTYPNIGALLLTTSGAVYALGAAKYYGGANGQSFFAGKTAAAFGALNSAETAAGKQYVFLSTDGSRYAFPL